MLEADETSKTISTWAAMIRDKCCHIETILIQPSCQFQLAMVKNGTSGTLYKVDKISEYITDMTVTDFLTGRGFPFHHNPS